jgi:hypothetical protein
MTIGQLGIKSSDSKPMRTNKGAKKFSRYLFNKCNLSNMWEMAMIRLIRGAFKKFKNQLRLLFFIVLHCL